MQSKDFCWLAGRICQIRAESIFRGGGGGGGRGKSLAGLYFFLEKKVLTYHFLESRAKTSFILAPITFISPREKMN